MSSELADAIDIINIASWIENKTQSQFSVDLSEPSKIGLVLNKCNRVGTSMFNKGPVEGESWSLKDVFDEAKLISDQIKHAYNLDGEKESYGRITDWMNCCIGLLLCSDQSSER